MTTGRALPTILLLAAAALGAAGAPQALVRAHRAGDAAEYRVTLRVQSELTGQRAEKIGAKTYAVPLERRAEAQVEWTARRQVLSVDAQGIALVEETLRGFTALAAAGQPADEETQQLVAALSGALGAWSGSDPRAIRYRETPSGQLLDLGPEGVPQLGEPAPPLLTLWLLRALRPAVSLPDRPVRLDDRWQEPRAAELEHWRDVRGAETGQWLAPGLSFEPAVRLHVVQHLAGSVVSGDERAPDGTAEARFHGESLATIALADARLLAAGRTATREVTRTLGPVPGLSEPPRFTARLSVEVRIEEVR